MAENESGPPARILLIDDDPDLGRLVKMMLERIGLETHTTETGVSGMLKLRDEPFNLLILDLMLPDMDGFDVLQNLRQDSAFESLPILVLSARADSEAITKGLALGADGYITKPYLPHTLTERVRTLLAQGRRAQKDA